MDKDSTIVTLRFHFDEKEIKLGGDKRQIAELEKFLLYIDHHFYNIVRVSSCSYQIYSTCHFSAENIFYRIMLFWSMIEKQFTKRPS